jgi:hypothetical protein
VKPGRAQWFGCDAREGEKNAHKCLVGKPLGRLRKAWRINYKTETREIVDQDVRLME